MTDNKIGPNVRPIQESRTPERTGRKEPAQGLDFSNTLKQVLNDINAQPGKTAASSDTKALLDEVAAQDRQMAKMRQVEQALREQYARTQGKPSQDKE